MASGILIGMQMGLSDLAEVSGPAYETEKVKQVLGTRAGFGTGVHTRPGEVRWDSGFGCRFHAFLHSADTPAFRAACISEARRAFRALLPRYVFTGLEVVTSDSEPNGVSLQVSFVTPSGRTDQVKIAA